MGQSLLIGIRKRNFAGHFHPRLRGLVLFQCWAGYNRFSENIETGRTNLLSFMLKHRQFWIGEIIRRDIRIVDIQILRNMGRSYSFFASTSIFVLAGLIAVLGVTDSAIYFLRFAVLGFGQSRA